jgi:hypothetical protein
MKSFFAFILLLSFAASPAFASAPSRYDEALKLLEIRKAGNNCDGDEEIYQSVVIEMVARAIADDPSGLQNFLKQIPAGTDILRNVEFRALVANVDLTAVTDSAVLTKVLTGSRLFSRASGARVGHSVVVDLKSRGRATVTKLEVQDDGTTKVTTIKARWKSRAESESHGDNYQFLVLYVKGEKWTSLLKRFDANLFFEDTTAGQIDDNKTFLTAPNECGS